MDEAIRKYLRRIGKRGGRSRSPEKLSAVKKNLAKARRARKGGAR